MRGTRGDVAFYTRRNPWAAIGMSIKAVLECKIPRTAADPTPAQEEVRRAFGAIAAQSITIFPADGLFMTLVARVKWIGQQLAGKVYARQVVVPRSALESHPAVVRAAARGQTVIRRGAVAVTLPGVALGGL